MEKYSFEQSFQEAEKMKEKIQNEEAKSYTEAEKIVDNEEKKTS